MQKISFSQISHKNWFFWNKNRALNYDCWDGSLFNRSIRLSPFPQLKSFVNFIDPRVNEFFLCSRSSEERNLALSFLCFCSETQTNKKEEIRESFSKAKRIRVEIEGFPQVLQSASFRKRESLISFESRIRKQKGMGIEWIKKYALGLKELG